MVIILFIDWEIGLVQGIFNIKTLSARYMVDFVKQSMPSHTVLEKYTLFWKDVNEDL